MRTEERRDGLKMVILCLTMVMGLALVVGPTLIQGQETGFPSRPVEIMVPFAPGGSLDIGARALCRALFSGVESPGHHKKSSRWRRSDWGHKFL